MRSNRLAKFLTYAIPVLAFTVLVPLFEHETEAKNTGRVLGAYTDSANLTDQLSKADFNVAQEIPRGEKPVQIQGPVDSVVAISAKSVLVYDASSQEELWHKDAEQKLQIASLTKLMTAIIATESPDFDKAIEITSRDHVSVAPVLGLRNGDKILPKDLIAAMLVGSANDAAATLANHFPDRQSFVGKMNEKAKTLGMINTHFSNPIGFDSEDNYSTATDLKILVEYALKTLPYEQLWQENDFSFASEKGVNYHIKNSNTLVRGHQNIRSIKTGLTPGALGNMVVEAVNDQGNKIIAIVLGAADRNKETLKAVDYSFDNFKWLP